MMTARQVIVWWSYLILSKGPFVHTCKSTAGPANGDGPSSGGDFTIVAAGPISGGAITNFAALHLAARAVFLSPGLVLQGAVQFSPHNFALSSKHCTARYSRRRKSMSFVQHCVQHCAAVGCFAVLYIVQYCRVAYCPVSTAHQVLHITHSVPLYWQWGCLSPCQL